MLPLDTQPVATENSLLFMAWDISQVITMGIGHLRRKFFDIMGERNYAFV
jgi:hypothetical protein